MEDNVKNPISEEAENVTPAENDALLEMVENPIVEEDATEEVGSALVAGVMTEKNIQQVTAQQRIMKILVQVGLYLFLGIMAIIVVFPFYWMISSSFKGYAEYKQDPPTFFPNNFSGPAFYNRNLHVIYAVDNYTRAFKLGNLVTLFLNTTYVGIISTLLSLIITVLSAFAFARLEFKGKNALFTFLLATMMLPGELFTITNYQTVLNLGWLKLQGYDFFITLIVPFLVSVFYIYLLRQNFMQIPNELYLAAKVDGTTDFKYLWKVMIPLAMPTLISITILKMMGAWNSYAWPNLVTSDSKLWLITNGLRSFNFDANGNTASTGQVDYPLQMAAVTVVSIPLFMVFVFLRKYIMKGVSRSGIKG